MNYNGMNSYVFTNGVEIHKFKAKDSKINTTPLCVGRAFQLIICKRLGLMVMFSMYLRPGL